MTFARISCFSGAPGVSKIEDFGNVRRQGDLRLGQPDGMQVRAHELFIGDVERWRSTIPATMSLRRSKKYWSCGTLSGAIGHDDRRLSRSDRRGRRAGHSSPASAARFADRRHSEPRCRRQAPSSANRTGRAGTAQTRRRLRRSAAFSAMLLPILLLESEAPLAPFALLLGALGPYVPGLRGRRSHSCPCPSSRRSQYRACGSRGFWPSLCRRPTCPKAVAQPRVRGAKPVDRPNCRRPLACPPRLRGSARPA